MSKKRFNYWVETFRPSLNKWVFVIGSMGNKSYATGWLHGLTSYYPCPRARLIKSEVGNPFRTGKLNPAIVLEEHQGNSAPKPVGSNMIVRKTFDPKTGTERVERTPAPVFTKREKP